MDEPARLSVILCWHMHQPEYRDPANGEYRFPWTLLHALKDYTDMAAHLEAEPGARAVVNFAPILLEQLADYAAQLEAHFAHGAALRDPLLAALAGDMPAGAEARAALLRQCLRANERRVIARFPAYQRLVGLATQLAAEERDIGYLADAFLGDLLAWYFLAWLGETVRRADPRVRALEEQGRDFTLEDRRGLLALVHELLAGLLPRYRRLAGSGQVELAMSPYAHPILPLLLDLGAGREALPESPVPAAAHYPGGAERARWHLRHGREVFRRHLGVSPAGCWPSEGALSTATLQLLAEEGFRWCASGEGVLRNSREAQAAVLHGQSGAHPHEHEHAPGHACRHRVYRAGGAPIDCFFRDDGLSDLIGFSYADWHAEDAVANLLHHMENIAGACPDRRNCALAVILDGENAWEYYPENAYHFFSALYRALAAHPRLQPTTFSAFLRDARPEPAQLPRLVAGSWVYGTLSTWVGSVDKNRGWDMLVEAKQACDRVLAGGEVGPEARLAIERQLAVCEGSDWFWWFGDYNPAQSVSDFEQLFRLQLAHLYRLLGIEAPASLGECFTQGAGDPARGGVMRPGAEPA